MLGKYCTTKTHSHLSKWLIWKIHNNNLLLSILTVNKRNLYFEMGKILLIDGIYYNKVPKTGGFKQHKYIFFLVWESRHLRSMCWLIENFIFPLLMWSLLYVHKFLLLIRPSTILQWGPLPKSFNWFASLNIISPNMITTWSTRD